MKAGQEKTPLIVLIAMLAEADQVKPYELPGIWTREIDENWTIKLNAKRTEQEGIAPYHPECITEQRYNSQAKEAGGDEEE